MAPQTDRRGLLAVISSPSGAGKSTVTRRLLASEPRLRLSISATTRPMRPGEQHGREYYFMSEAEFQKHLELTGEDGGCYMLEHAEVFGNYYGTPRAPVEAWLQEGRDVVFDIDWQGTAQLRHSALAADLVTIFLLPPSIGELERRLVERAQDSTDVVSHRMERSRVEISHWFEYDYVLINDDLDKCIQRVEEILHAERMRRSRQIGLKRFVAGLDKEYEEMFG